MKPFLFTLISLAKILVRTQWGLKKPILNEKGVVIIGNGPSASEFLENALTKKVELPLMAVNLFASTEYFHKLQPHYYNMLDHAFLDFPEKAFNDPTSLERLKIQPGFLEIQQKINAAWEAIFQATWPITLFIPAIYKKEFIVQLALKKGIRIIFHNYVVVKGYTFFENWIYKNGWGSPQSQNVINSCIFLCINAGFKEIYLTGVDNNFHLNMQVDENNQLQHVDNHFYHVKQKITPQLHADGSPVKMHEFFFSLHKAFKTHHRLAAYAQYRNARVLNSTKGSFIDAYPRKEIPFE